MSSATGIRAGRAYVELGVENNALSTGLRAAQQRVQSFGASIAGAGTTLMGIGAAIGTPLGMATTVFAGYEKQMARVKAISGSTPEEFARLSAEAKRLGEVTEYSATQAAAMMTEFATRGYKVNDMLAAAGPALQMATAGQLELAEAAGIAGDIMGGMRIQAKDLGEVTDKLTYAFSNSATDLRQLGEAFKYVGPSASDMGFSLDEVSSALMVLANNGQKADMAGTTLRGIFETLKDPPSEARKELEKLGVVLDNGHGKFRKLDEIIGDMQQGLSKLSKVDKAAAISRIFTNRQTTGTSILVGENDKGVANVDVMRDFQTRLDTEAGGTGNRVQATMLDTLWGSWKLIESAVEGVAITIGEELMPTIREWGSAIIGGVGVFGAILKENKAWIPTIAKTGAALFIVGSAITAVGLGFLGVGAVMAGLATGWGMMVGAVGAVVAGIAALFTPIGLVVVGITAGVVAFATMTDAGRAMTADLSKYFANLGSTFSSTIGSIGETFGQAWGGIVDAVKGGDLGLAAKIAWKGLEIVWQKGVNWISGVWSGFSDFFVDVFAEAGASLVRGINLVWAGLELMWFDSFGAIGKAWGTTLDGMLKAYHHFVYQSQLAWIAWQNSVGAMSNHNRTLQETIAFSGDAESADPEKRKGYRQRIVEIVENRKKVDAENQKGRQDIVKRKEGVDKGIDDDLDRGRKDRANAARKAETEATKKLARAEAELAKLVLDAAPLDRSLFESDGEMMLKISKIPTIKSVNESVAQATGIGVGDTAGTFDANMIRFIAGTGNDSMEKEQLRKQEEQIQILKRMLDEIKKSVAGGIFG